MSIRPPPNPVAPTPRWLVITRQLSAVLGCGLALAWSWARLRESDPKTALLRDIAGGNVEARRRAVVDLGDQPPDQIAAVLKGLSGALDDADPGVREQAALAIGRATSFASDWLKASERPEGDAAIRTLSAHRADGSPAVRRAVASSVALCATGAREAASHARIAGTLRALMADPDASVRLVATRSLDDPLYRRDPANVAAFEAATSDPDPAVRLRAGFAAIQQEALTKRGERMILKLFDDPDPLVHKLGENGVAVFLGELDAEEVLPRLVARMAVYRLALLSPPGVITSAYLPPLSSRDDRSSQLLMGMGVRGAASARQLAEWVDDRTGRTFREPYEASRVLGAVAPGSPEANARLEILLANLRTGSHLERYESVMSLGSYLWARERVGPALRAAADDPLTHLRDHAQRSLDGGDPPLRNFPKRLDDQMDYPR